MRAISFMLTTEQIRARTKDVTRRNGWANLKAGDRLRGVKKAMGLKKGEKHDVLAIIEVVSARRERLDLIDEADVIREGFDGLTPPQFVAMFCRSHKGVVPSSEITRIEFKYVESEATR